MISNRWSVWQSVWTRGGSNSEQLSPNRFEPVVWELNRLHFPWRCLFMLNQCIVSEVCLLCSCLFLLSQWSYYFALLTEDCRIFLASRAQDVGRSASARSPFSDAAYIAGCPTFTGVKLDGCNCCRLDSPKIQHSTWFSTQDSVTTIISRNWFISWNSEQGEKEIKPQEKGG